ncbi:hypothetical protein [Kitasatospora indigofera]|uniref:hypothetical protein n=1 Tax=Kitasatospora indigofera TaxID=67307 RepID=UPI0036A45531
MLGILKRASIAVAVVGTASVATITAGAGAAAAAPAGGYVNTFDRTFYADGTPHGTSWNLCGAYAGEKNWIIEMNGGDTSKEYWYCADGPNGGVNAWWRHWVS